MSDDEPGELSWDEVVDVLCVGSGPGVLAYAIAAAQRDADVLFIGPAEYGDPDTAGYLSGMTEDLDSGRPADLDLPVVAAEPVAETAGRRDRIEPFVGSRLRDFSARCAASVFGVLHTQSDTGGIALRAGEEILHATELGRLRLGGDRPGPALIDWLDERAGELGVRRDDEITLQRLVFDGLRVVGAAVGGPAGTRLVGTASGVVLATRAIPDEADWPSCPELRDTEVRVAMVRQTAGRFARVLLLKRQAEKD